MHLVSDFMVSFKPELENLLDAVDEKGGKAYKVRVYLGLGLGLKGGQSVYLFPLDPTISIYLCIILIKVLVYSGQLDVIIGAALTERFLPLDIHVVLVNAGFFIMHIVLTLSTA